jgi:hypothetical protein
VLKTGISKPARTIDDYRGIESPRLLGYGQVHGLPLHSKGGRLAGTGDVNYLHLLPSSQLGKRSSGAFRQLNAEIGLRGKVLAAHRAAAVTVDLYLQRKLL